VQVVIALVVTPQGLPLAYEVLAGKTRDCTTLKDFLARIERQYGKAQRVWCMDCFRQLDLAHFDALIWPTPGGIDSRFCCLCDAGVTVCEVV